MTYSPFESIAGIESDVPVPGPVIKPPVAFFFDTPNTVLFAASAGVIPPANIGKAE